MPDKKQADLKIFNAGKMTREERKNVAIWLLKQARSLIKEGEIYTNGYRAVKYK